MVALTHRCENLRVGLALLENSANPLLLSCTEKAYHLTFGQSRLYSKQKRDAANTVLR